MKAKHLRTGKVYALKVRPRLRLKVERLQLRELSRSTDALPLGPRPDPSQILDVQEMKNGDMLEQIEEERRIMVSARLLQRMRAHTYSDAPFGPRPLPAAHRKPSTPPPSPPTVGHRHAPQHCDFVHVVAGARQALLSPRARARLGPL